MLLVLPHSPLCYGLVGLLVITGFSNLILVHTYQAWAHSISNSKLVLVFALQGKTIVDLFYGIKQRINLEKEKCN